MISFQQQKKNKYSITETAPGYNTLGTYLLKSMETIVQHWLVAVCTYLTSFINAILLANHSRTHNNNNKTPSISLSWPNHAGVVSFHGNPQSTGWLASLRYSVAWARFSFARHNWIDFAAAWHCHKYTTINVKKIYLQLTARCEAERAHIICLLHNEI